MTDWPLLSLLVWVPIFGGILILAADKKLSDTFCRILALLISLVTFALSVLIAQQFDSSLATMQFPELHSWIAPLGVKYALGVDGIALPLILLTTLITMIVVVAGWHVIQTRVAQYFAAFLIMEGAMNGVFSAMDGLLFYVFWEAMLIPMFLIIGIWGGPNRVYATIKFFLYTFLGSVFMLVSLVYLGLSQGNFMLQNFYGLPLSATVQTLIFLSFLLAFAVKIPMWPVHTWLPDAHVEAPTGGSVVLAAIMLKMGGYGFLRFSLPITPLASASLSSFIMALSLIAVIYIGFVAIVQRDMKKLIAYSSIAHMGFVTLGLFLMFFIAQTTKSVDSAVLGIEGAMFQMISHGFISAALFLCVGVLYDRMHSREIADYGGVANSMPNFAAFFMLFALANAGVPGTSAFVGEFLVVLSSFHASAMIAILAGTTLILSPAYTLWMYKRVVYGPVANEKVAQLKDIECHEWITLGVLAGCVILFGVWPEPLIKMMHASVVGLVHQVNVLN